MRYRMRFDGERCKERRGWMPVFTLLQCTWGALQTLFGAIVLLFHLSAPHARFHGTLVTVWKRRTSVSLGAFLFVSERAGFSMCGGGQIVPSDEAMRLLRHEYGHAVQSRLLGPLYLVVIGIPSFLWCTLPCFRRMRRERGIPYDALYTERWATAWGESALLHARPTERTER